MVLSTAPLFFFLFLPLRQVLMRINIAGSEKKLPFYPAHSAWFL
jgi:hypothetical protein